MRSLSILAAFLGAASASPFTHVARNLISARAAPDSAQFTFVNNLNAQQKVYIVGRVDGKWAFVKQDGSVAFVGHFNSLADIAITLAANCEPRTIDIPRPLEEGRIYSAESDLGFAINGENLGHPFPGHNAQPSEAIRWNFMDFRLPSGNEKFLNAAINYQHFIGTPAFSFSIDGGATVQGLRNDCVDNFCKRPESHGLCVVSGGKNLRVFQPEPFIQAHPQDFAEDCQKNSEDGRGTRVVPGGHQMTITLG